MKYVEWNEGLSGLLLSFPSINAEVPTAFDKSKFAFQKSIWCWQPTWLSGKIYMTRQG